MSRRQMNWNEQLKKLERENSFFFLLDCIQPLIFFCLERNCVYIRNWYAVAVPCRKISIRYIPNSTQGIFVNVSKKKEKWKNNGWTRRRYELMQPFWETLNRCAPPTTRSDFSLNVVVCYGAKSSLLWLGEFFFTKTASSMTKNSFFPHFRSWSRNLIGWTRSSILSSRGKIPDITFSPLLSKEFDSQSHLAARVGSNQIFNTRWW